MLIINKEQFNFQPLMDVTAPDRLTDELMSAAQTYILANTRPTYHQGQKVDAFFISGLAEYHHAKFRDYLNSQVLPAHGLTADLRHGHFADFPAVHHWLTIQNLILDLTIRQFCLAQIKVEPTLQFSLNRHYFISNNARSPIYNLYF